MLNKKGTALSFIYLIAAIFFFATPTRAAELNLPYDLKIEGLSLNFPFSRVNKPTSYELLLNFRVDKKSLVATDTKDLTTIKEVISTPLPAIEPTPTPTLIPTTKTVAKEETKKVLAKELIPEPTIKPVATVEPTPQPTEKPKEEVEKPVEAQGNPVGGLDPEKLFRMSNEHRASKGLPAFEKDERSCKLAQERAPEISAEISGGYMHKGMRDRNLGYWNSENIITMRTEEAAFNWWINDYIHRVQIEGDYKYSCVACFGSACVQEFTNFTPKG